MPAAMATSSSAIPSHASAPERTHGQWLAKDMAKHIEARHVLEADVQAMKEDIAKLTNNHLKMQHLEEQLNNEQTTRRLLQENQLGMQSEIARLRDSVEEALLRLPVEDTTSLERTIEEVRTMLAQLEISCSSKCMVVHNELGATDDSVQLLYNLFNGARTRVEKLENGRAGFVTIVGFRRLLDKVSVVESDFKAFQESCSLIQKLAEERHDLENTRYQQLEIRLAAYPSSMGDQEHQEFVEYTRITNVRVERAETAQQDLQRELHNFRSDQTGKHDNLARVVQSVNQAHSTQLQTSIVQSQSNFEKVETTQRDLRREVYENRRDQSTKLDTLTQHVQSANHDLSVRLDTFAQDIRANHDQSSKLKASFQDLLSERSTNPEVLLHSQEVWQTEEERKRQAWQADAEARLQSQAEWQTEEEAKRRTWETTAEGHLHLKAAWQAEDEAKRKIWQATVETHLQAQVIWQAKEEAKWKAWQTTAEAHVQSQAVWQAKEESGRNAWQENAENHLQSQLVAWQSGVEAKRNVWHENAETHLQSQATWQTGEEAKRKVWQDNLEAELTTMIVPVQHTVPQLEGRVSGLERAFRLYSQQHISEMQGQSSAVSTLGGHIMELRSLVDIQDQETKGLRFDISKEVTVLGQQISGLEAGRQRETLTDNTHDACAAAREADRQASIDRHHTRDELYGVRFSKCEEQTKLLREEVRSTPHINPTQDISPPTFANSSFSLDYSESDSSVDYNSPRIQSSRTQKGRHIGADRSSHFHQQKTSTPATRKQAYQAESSKQGARLSKMRNLAIHTHWKNCEFALRGGTCSAIHWIGLSGAEQRRRAKGKGRATLRGGVGRMEHSSEEWWCTSHCNGWGR